MIRSAPARANLGFLPADGSTWNASDWLTTFGFTQPMTTTATDTTPPAAVDPARQRAVASWSNMVRAVERANERLPVSAQVKAYLQQATNWMREHPTETIAASVALVLMAFIALSARRRR